MLIRLQHYVHAFGAQGLNAFDLDFWNTETTLSSFGVELRVFSGFVEVDLQRISHDGQVELLETLSQADHGLVYSRPYDIAEMSGLIQPIVRSASPDADFFLYFGTNDTPANGTPKVCFVVDNKGLDTQMPEFRHFTKSARDGRGPEAHLLVTNSSGAETEPRFAAAVSHLPHDMTARNSLRAAIADLCFSDAPKTDTTHICILENDRPAHPEMMARLCEIVRFVKPRRIVAAHAYCSENFQSRANGFFGTGLGDPKALDWPMNAVGPSVDLDSPQPLTAEIRMPFQGLPGLLCLPMADVRRAGLPRDGGHDGTLLNYLTRLADNGTSTVVSIALGIASRNARFLSRRHTLADAFTALAETRQIRTRAGLIPRIGALATALSRVEKPADQSVNKVEVSRAAFAAFGAVHSKIRILRIMNPVLRRFAPIGSITNTRIKWRARQENAARNPFGKGRYAAAIWRTYNALADRMDASRVAGEVERNRANKHMSGMLHRAGLDHPERIKADLQRPSTLALATLRNSHLGQRAFIIGNGPSLTYADLERLKNEITFASNKIYLGFDAMAWRPTYYSVEDHLVLTNNMPEIEALRGSVKIFPDGMRDYGYVDPGTIFVKRIPPASWTDPLSDPQFPNFSFDLVEGLHWGSTIVYSQIQMAVHMGCKEIYLIGVDHSYHVSGAKEGNTYVSNGEVNHFHKDYRTAGERWHQPNLDVLEVSYKKAHDICAARGIKVMNASRTTKLTAFPLVDFDRIFD